MVHLVAQQVAKAALVDVVRHDRARIFALPVEMSALDPRAVVGAVLAHDGSQRRAHAGVLFSHSVALAPAMKAASGPAGPEGIQHPCAVALAVREDDVLLPVVIDIGEAKARVSTCPGHNRRSLRQSEGKLLPAFLPEAINRGLCGRPDDQFTDSVAIDIAQAHAPVGALAVRGHPGQSRHQ